MNIINKSVFYFKDHIKTEPFVILLVAIIPLTYMYFDSRDIKVLESNTGAFLLKGFLLEYTGCLTLGYCFITFVRHFYRKGRMKFVHRVFSQAGTGIINAYRLGAGVFISVSLIWVLEEYSTLTTADATKIIVLLFWSIVFMSISAVGSSIHQAIEEKF